MLSRYCQSGGGIVWIWLIQAVQIFFALFYDNEWMSVPLDHKIMIMIVMVFKNPVEAQDPFNFVKSCREGHPILFLRWILPGANWQRRFELHNFSCSKFQRFWLLNQWRAEFEAKTRTVLLWRSSSCNDVLSLLDDSYPRAFHILERSPWVNSWERASDDNASRKKSSN